MAHILVAPSAFKGTLTAVEAAEVIGRELSTWGSVVACPLADGGDGTLEVLVRAGGGSFLEAQALDALGEPVQAQIGLLPTGVAVIEMARASGLAVMGERQNDILKASSRGLGQMISAALDHSPRRIIVGLGGSATCDGGIGALQSLGIGFFDRAGAGVVTAGDLPRLERIDETFRDSRLSEVEIVLACDVENPLLGPMGAARVFAPQKGAGPQQVDLLEAGLQRLAEVLLVGRGRWVGEVEGGGSAGGAAAGLYGVLGAEIRSGFDLVAEMTGFAELLAEASLLIVAEGSLDSQSEFGKATLAAAGRARDQGVPVWAIGGRMELTERELASYGVVAACDLSRIAHDPLGRPREALTEGVRWLRDQAAEKP